MSISTRSARVSFLLGVTLELDAFPSLLSLPEPGRDPVDHQKADTRGPFVLATAMGRNLATCRVGHELVALAEAHHVDVVLGQQPYARCRLRKVGVTDEDEGFVSFDVHHLQLVPDRVEQRSRVGRLELHVTQTTPRNPSA